MIYGMTRRTFLKTAAIGGAALSLPLGWNIGRAYAFANSPNLAKWAQAMRGLGGSGLPVLSGVPDPVFPNCTLFRVTIGEFKDVLHPAFQNSPTTLWGYADTTNLVQRHLGGVVLINRGTAARIRFTNTLPSRHILPVDTTIPGANQAQNRVATHLHGGLVPWISDGGPFDWWAPNGSSGLSFLNGKGSLFDKIPALPMTPAQADYYYPNDQSARLVWYHDHAFGITRLNAYAGIASAYKILDTVEANYISSGKIPGLASLVPLVFQDKVFVNQSTAVTDPAWYTKTDAKSQTDGSLWYPHIYETGRWRNVQSPKYLTPPDPSAIPEFFADTMLCNGLVYPLLTLEAKRYRFLVLNACNARFLNINLFQANPNNTDGIDLDPVAQFPTNPVGPAMIQIGNECGFLVSEVTYNQAVPANPVTFSGNLLMGPAERAELIIDFTGQAGNEYILYNDAPAPFPGGDPRNDYYLGNPLNPVQPQSGTGPDTRQILRIKIVAAGNSDSQPAGPILDPLKLDPQPLVPITAAQFAGQPIPVPAGSKVRYLTLNEDFDQYGRLKQMLGTNVPQPTKGFGRDYLSTPTEVIQNGTTEVWRIFNTTGDTHPMHFHLINAQILSRQAFTVVNGAFAPLGAARGPELNELGWKETIRMNPGEVTTFIAKFDLPQNLPFTVPTSPRATITLGNQGMGLPSGKKYHEYVWHCHILEHEEHDMMRPLVVTS